MKKLFLLLLLAGSANAAPLPGFKSLPDYRRDYHCLPFSQQCVLALHARGIPATQIFYRWNAPGESGAHAAVLFQNEGAFWFMDNTLSAPRRVTAKTDFGCIVQVTSKQVFITLVDRLGNSVAAKPMAERFSKAGL